VPRTKIAATLRHIGEVSKKYGVTISNIFHAGDGNMHPIILFNGRIPGELERAQQAGFEILRYCISVGGSITGEHGVGMEKMDLMPEQFDPASLAMMQRFKDVFDPESRLNPGKVLPTGKGCLEIRHQGMAVTF
jgi:glycolate oxidase